MTTKFVREVMHPGVVTISETATLREAIKHMTDRAVRSLVITDEACAVRGIVSQTDFVNISLRESADWASMRVGEIMTRTVLTVTPDMPLNDAAKMLIENHVHRIIVVDSDDPCLAVGMLSMTDIMRDLME